MNLLQLGDFHLHSGEKSQWKIDCDTLTDDDLRTVATLLVDRLPPFGAVHGIPTGGERLARIMQRNISSGPMLIVDDGRSMDEAREKMVKLRQNPYLNNLPQWNVESPPIGAVIFARGHCPNWVIPLFVVTGAGYVGVQNEYRD